MSADRKQAAAKLCEIRQKLGMTQPDFSALLGVTLSTYRKYEQAVRQPPESVLKLASIAVTNPELVASV